MKKMLYVVLPAIFLSLCAGNVFAQVKEIKMLTLEQKDYLSKSLEKTKTEQERTSGEYMEVSKAIFDLNSMVNAQEITAGEKINLQNIL